MSAHRVRRPVEEAAVAAASRRPRVFRLPSVLADMTTANRLNDREGLLLLACRAARAVHLEAAK